MHSKAKCHDENRSNLEMYIKTKFENRLNLVIYSDVK